MTCSEWPAPRASGRMELWGDEMRGRRSADQQTRRPSVLPPPSSRRARARDVTSRRVAVGAVRVPWSPRSLARHVARETQTALTGQRATARARRRENGVLGVASRARTTPESAPRRSLIVTA